MATAKKAPEKSSAVKAAAPVAKKAAKKAVAEVAPKTAKAKATTSAPESKPGIRKSRKTGNTVPADQRAHYIEVAAFYIAERRGFAPGDPMDDWLAAEAEIDRLLADGRLG